MAAKKFRDWAQKHQMTMLSPTPGVPSLVDEIAGPGVKGSWWSHPKSGAIYNTSQALLDDPDILSLKLVGGKVTFMHSETLPLLLRVVSDPEWRKRKITQIDPEARRLLEHVDDAGVIRIDMLACDWKGGAKTLKKSKKILEEHALAIGGDVHTESGTHASTLESWSHVCQRMGREPDWSVEFQEAIDRLKRLAGGNRLTV